MLFVEKWLISITRHNWHGFCITIHIKIEESKMSKANMQSAIKKLSIGMLIIGSLSLSSCANTAQEKNNNQSKQRTIVSYLA
jgi:hypothetical protein